MSVSALMEIFLYGSFAYALASILAEATKITSFKIFGIGFMLMPIFIFVGKYFEY